MLASDLSPLIYQAPGWIRHISPIIRHRLWVRSDSVLPDFQYQSCLLSAVLTLTSTLLACMTKTPVSIESIGHRYSTDAREVTLAKFSFHHNERFLYEYDFGAFWRHEICMEQRLSFGGRRLYSVRISGGRRSGPPQDCGGQ